MTNNAVLIVDDNETDRTIISIKVKKSFERPTAEAENGEEALDILSQNNHGIDLVLLDQNMPGLSGLQTLERIKKQHPSLPVIMVTGTQDTNLAIEAIRKGASDFITKPFQDERLFASIHNATKINAMSSEIKELKKTQTFEDLIGYNQGLSQSIEIAKKAAEYDIPILITGETGTGKEVLARAIHGESKRAHKPFTAVNCGAIPEHLVESTLFGHKKGAFTGAVSDSLGRFQEAEGGTIFLDEIGDLPLDAQVKILRVLQQKVLRPVGGDKGVPVDVRIISATNKNLNRLVEKEAFREDLFFRLNVLSIEIPPMRERRGDIIDLAQHFIEIFAANEGMPILPIDKDAQTLLQDYWWPGNVREMENAINRAMVLTKSTSLTVNCFDLLSDRRGSERGERKEPNSKATTATQPEPLAYLPRANAAPTVNLKNQKGEIKPMEQLEHEIATIILDLFAGNISKTSKALGVSRSTLYRKLER